MRLSALLIHRILSSYRHLRSVSCHIATVPGGASAMYEGGCREIAWPGSRGRIASLARQQTLDAVVLARLGMSGAVCETLVSPRRQGAN